MNKPRRELYLTEVHVCALGENYKEVLFYVVADAVRQANLLLEKYRKAKTIDEGNIKRQRSRDRGL